MRRPGGPEQVAQEVPATLPSPLLQAIANAAGGRVVLILGAGASHEHPTGLPLAGQLAARCHQELIDDGVIAPDACGDANDLSAVAEAVFEATGHQDALVERFPPEALRAAEPNSGYEIAAALLREGAVKDVMTLNFDLVASTALGMLGAREVATLQGPEDHASLSAHNLIYLHRSINRPPDDLILRPEALEVEWQGAWEDVIAQRVMATPFIIFVGLGTPAKVLIRTAEKISAAVGAGSEIYVVDPMAHANSRFAADLNVQRDRYIEMGWCEFMNLLGSRVAVAHCRAIEQACGSLVREEGLPQEEPRPLLDRIASLGIVGLGRVRAAWLLHKGSYMPREEAVVENLADLVLGLSLVERVQQVSASIEETGAVEFTGDSGTRARILVGHGLGTYGEARLLGELHARRARLPLNQRRIDAALVGGIRASHHALSVPESIAGSDERESVVAPPEVIDFVTLEGLRADPALAARLAA